MRWWVAAGLLAMAPPAGAQESELTPVPAVSPTPDPVRQREMQVYFLIGSENYKDGNYQAAIDAWQEVLKIQPDHALAKEKIRKAKEMLRPSGERRAPSE